jgi:flagellar hook-basal body complex protein FliE
MGKTTIIAKVMRSRRSCSSSFQAMTEVRPNMLEGVRIED